MSKPGNRISRLFIDAALSGGRLELPPENAHYVGAVLRLRVGDGVIVFNGRGDERRAVVAGLSRKGASLTLAGAVEPLAEPELELTLIQGLVKSDAMDIIVQKATELGAAGLFAVGTQFSVVKLDDERRQRRLEHWMRIAHSACEQSGRHRPAQIRLFATLDDGIAALPDAGLRLVLHPGAAPAVRGVDASARRISVAVGPEGGFSRLDLETLDAAGFERVGLGPRTLRADTAAIAACALAQTLWGDGSL